MIYSYKEVSNKLDELLEYSKLKQSSSFHPQMTAQVNKVKTVMSSYLNTRKNEIAKKLEEFIQSYLWYSSNKIQECENDEYLGISIPTLPSLYFIDDFRLLTTNGCFDFGTIMNTSNVDFNNAWHVVSSNNYVAMVNNLIGYNESYAGVSQTGWCDYIAGKREVEIKNISDAITTMENCFWEVPDVIETFEDRGNPKNDHSVIVDTSPKKYKVIVRTIDGDRIEERYGENAEYILDPSSTVEGTAKLIYLPEFKGMFDIIRCLDLYNINDFSVGSKPCSTYGDNKVYIPSYLKEEFKKLL